MIVRLALVNNVRVISSSSPKRLAESLITAHGLALAAARQRTQAWRDYLVQKLAGADLGDSLINSKHLPVRVAGVLN